MSNHSSFIWGIDDLLRGRFKSHQYDDFILPFTVLRRLDSLLVDTKPKVLEIVVGAEAKNMPIGTLLERTTWYVMLVHLPVDHPTESVRDGLITTMATLPGHLRGSLTWDQDTEMSLHKAFGIATDRDVYCCDPASPWQRGFNEDTNGLLRQYFPEGTDLKAYGPEDLEHVSQQLNSRPRKTLDWDTPAQRLRGLLIAS